MGLTIFAFFLYILRVEFRLSYSSMQRDKYCDLVPRDALTRTFHCGKAMTLALCFFPALRYDSNMFSYSDATKKHLVIKKPNNASNKPTVWCTLVIWVHA